MVNTLQIGPDFRPRFRSRCPLYPVGSDVVFTAGEFQGYRGIVAAVNSKNIYRPQVRILFDPVGNKVSPLHVDTGADEETQIAFSD
ncbi:MAG: hypothetical protein Q7O66_11635 [Dehalococcoidia bacterium]|nr:hypothetical protein [Dehalococcoidia bacterium]